MPGDGIRLYPEVVPWYPEVVALLPLIQKLCCLAHCVTSQ